MKERKGKYLIWGIGIILIFILGLMSEQEIRQLWKELRRVLKLEKADKYIRMQ